MSSHERQELLAQLAEAKQRIASLESQLIKVVAAARKINESWMDQLLILLRKR